MTRKDLLDVNVLIALTEPGHMHYERALQWFNSAGRHGLGICPLTEAGFIRITTSPSFRPGPRSLEQAIAVLQKLKGHPGYWYCSISESWVDVTAMFASRILGHQQITDAYLLGLAARENATLVTFDRAIQYLAGAEFSKNLLVLD